MLRTLPGAVCVCVCACVVLCCAVVGCTPAVITHTNKAPSFFFSFFLFYFLFLFLRYSIIFYSTASRMMPRTTAVFTGEVRRDDTVYCSVYVAVR